MTKGAVAENILHLTQLSEEQRTPTVCLRTPTLWLAVASLCVLDKDHVDRLSSGTARFLLIIITSIILSFSGQWNKEDGHPVPPRPTCSNHDDGETNAVIQCSVCGNLCADCDRFLHLHRKTRNHQRQVRYAIAFSLVTASNAFKISCVIIGFLFLIQTLLGM